MDPWTVAVVIPARNEAATIVPCLRAVLASYAACPLLSSRCIVIAADRCTDATVKLARRALGRDGYVLECDVGSAGAARRRGVAFALARLAHVDRRRLWIANTDADTIVARDWLSVQLGFARQEFVAVAGVVRVDAIPGHAADTVRALNASYEMQADGTHPHVHGANLGVRADAYMDVGGWSEARLSEDHRLWNSLRARGWRLRASARSTVLTSGRLDGRAAGGFADTLRKRLEALLAGS